MTAGEEQQQLHDWPHFKMYKSHEKKNMVMGLDGTQNQELLCWRGPAAV
jgi:hypothetical protein